MGASKSKGAGSAPSSASASAPASASSDVAARLSRARKLHALDLSRLPQLSALPPEARALPPLRRVDVSHTALRALPALASYAKLDQLDASACALAGAQPSLACAAALTQLALRDNKLLRAEDLAPPGFALPPSLRALSLAGCGALCDVPRSLRGAAGAALARLERLDLSACGLRVLPAALAALGGSLLELALDDNGLASLALEPGGEDDSNGAGDGAGAGARTRAAATWASFSSLTTLSARRCRIECSPAALPEALFLRTRLSALSLGGNAALSAAAVLRLPGCAAFEERRAARISKGMTSDGGDAAADRSFCGLDR
jgi:Leucine-rich repeat (LRR) protein